MRSKFLLYLCLIPLAFTTKAQSLDLQKEILYYINQARAKHHLNPLVLNNTASLQATIHSKAMSSYSIPFGHKNFMTRIKNIYSKIANCNGGAENVAYYKTDAKKLVDAWLHSYGHKRNILGNYNITGIGISYSKKPGWAYFTEIFIKSNSRI